MKDNFGKHSPRPERPGWIGILVAIVGVGLLAACSSGTSATTASGTSSTSSQYAKALVYAQCMRKHGDPNFPDPNSNGTFTQANNDSSGVSQSVVQAALSACQKLAPSGMQISQSQQQQVQTEGLKFAKCMRAHGVPNFQDPAAGGEIMRPKGVDPNSSTYVAALHVCQPLLVAPSGAAPQGGAPQGGTG